MTGTPHPDLPQTHLNAGGLVITSDPQWVLTVLGSCVSVTFFCPHPRLAAICHAMLPEPRDASPASRLAEPYRFLSLALPAMLDAFHRRNLGANDIEVKVFGGANVLQGGPGRAQDLWVGNANILAARRHLTAAGLTIRAENVGGIRGRKIIFNTHSGDVLHKHLTHAHDRIP